MLPGNRWFFFLIFAWKSCKSFFFFFYFTIFWRPISGPGDGETTPKIILTVFLRCVKYCKYQFGVSLYFNILGNFTHFTVKYEPVRQWNMLFWNFNYHLSIEWRCDIMLYLTWFDPVFLVINGYITFLRCFQERWKCF